MANERIQTFVQIIPDHYTKPFELIKLQTELSFFEGQKQFWQKELKERVAGKVSQGISPTKESIIDIINIVEELNRLIALKKIEITRYLAADASEEDNITSLSEWED